MSDQALLVDFLLKHPFREVAETATCGSNGDSMPNQARLLGSLFDKQARNALQTFCDDKPTTNYMVTFVKVEGRSVRNDLSLTMEFLPCDA